KLTGKVASVEPGLGQLSQHLSGRASPKDLSTMMELLWLRVTAPRADSAAHQVLLNQLRAVLQNKDANPQLVFNDTVTLTLANGSPRVRSLSTEVLDELQLDPMMRIYRDRFGDASNMTVVFVGNVSL